MVIIWCVFVVNIIVYGFWYVYESLLRIFCIMWLILLVIVVMCYVFFVLLSFVKYFFNLVIIELIEIVFVNGEFVFFVVIICNLNWFVKCKINMLEFEGDFYKLGLNFFVCEVIKKVNKDMICG